jgi:hypothetical protein
MREEQLSRLYQGLIPSFFRLEIKIVVQLYRLPSSLIAFYKNYILGGNVATKNT